MVLDKEFLKEYRKLLKRFLLQVILERFVFSTIVSDIFQVLRLDKILHLSPNCLNSVTANLEKQLNINRVILQI